jgi:hypothetical protein
VAANSAGLAAGAYPGSITISAPDSVNGSATIPVSLTVGSPTVVVSGASYLSEPGLSPGMIAVLFGSNLARPRSAHGPRVSKFRSFATNPCHSPCLERASTAGAPDLVAGVRRAARG